MTLLKTSKGIQDFSVKLVYDIKNTCYLLWGKLNR